MTGDRVEAAAKAIRRTTLGEQYPRLATTVRWQDYTVDAEAALAAADECDRVAGVVRVNTRDEALIDRLARVLCDVDQSEIEPERRETMEQTGSGDDFRDMVRALFAALAAAGAQPPPEGHHG